MRPYRILVVDDDPDIIVYLSTLLEDHGYVVASANDTPSAFIALENFRPDLALVDVLLPGRSGLDLVVCMRRDPRWCDIPLVVITGNDQVLQDDCQSYLVGHQDVRGPDGVLGKPMDPKTLLAVVHHLRDQQVFD
jgi:CheY-like chemotaxis protein